MRIDPTKSTTSRLEPKLAGIDLDALVPTVVLPIAATSLATTSTPLSGSQDATTAGKAIDLTTPAEDNDTESEPPRNWGDPNPYTDSESDDGYFESRQAWKEQLEEERQMPEQVYLKELSRAFKSESRISTFAFGDSYTESEEVILYIWRNGSIKEMGGQKRGEKYSEVSGIKGAAIHLPCRGWSLEEFGKYGSAAPFGKGHETVYDRSYRDAYEILPDHYSLNFDVLVRGQILSEIANRLRKKTQLLAHKAKLNIYGPGGHFMAHRDTPRSTSHIGTLVICLPSDFEGGALVVKQDKNTVRFDWADEGSTGFKWAFLFGDCEHEVEKVTRGRRLTIAYDIYAGPAQNDVKEATSTTLSTALKKALKDVDGFAPNGCTLAFGLKHGYSKSKRSFWENLSSILKPADEELYKVVKSLGLSVCFKAAYERPEYDDYDFKGPTEHARFLDMYRRTNVKHTRERRGLQKHRVFLSNDPNGLHDKETDDDGGGTDPLKGIWAELEANQSPDIQELVWVDYPASYAFANKTTFYGNDAGSTELIYSGVALLIEIPPGLDRRRWQ